MGSVLHVVTCNKFIFSRRFGSQRNRPILVHKEIDQNWFKKRQTKLGFTKKQTNIGSNINRPIFLWFMLSGLYQFPFLIGDLGSQKDKINLKKSYNTDFVNFFV